MFRSPDEEDRRLLERIVRRDEKALQILVLRHQRLLFGLCLRILENREDAEEAASEAFIKLWRRGESYRGDSSVKSFLCRIALNECHDRLRRRSPAPEEWREEGGAEMNEDTLAVSCAMHHLDEEDRTVIVLHHLQGLSTCEAAAALETTPGALKMRLVRARGRLKAILEDRND